MLTPAAAPTITIYDPAAAAANAGCSAAATSSVTDLGFEIGGMGAAGTAVGDKLAFHRGADARFRERAARVGLRR